MRKRLGKNQHTTFALVQIPIGFQFCSLKIIGKMTILSRMRRLTKLVHHKRKQEYQKTC